MKRQSWMAAVVVSFAVACGGQSSECRKALACLEAADPSEAAAQAEVYGPNGSCWQNGELASLCTNACASANASNKTKYANVAACQ